MDDFEKGDFTVNHYILPDLPYDYAALEPHLSGEIVQLHHDKHHRTYVTDANKTLEQLSQARHNGDYARIAGLERALAFNVSGHVLHSIYWQNLRPQGGGEPGGALATQIRDEFGSFDAFKQQMVRAAATTMGSGWAALMWDPISARLIVVQIHDHQSETAQASVPLMVLDAWEHAYYLQYRSDKAKYFEEIWNLWNWEDITARYLAVRNINLGLKQVAQPLDRRT
jgi:superoxide dismutase, Fe-Mn family